MENTALCLPADLKAAVKREAKARRVSETAVIPGIVTGDRGSTAASPTGGIVRQRRTDRPRSRRFRRAMIVDTSALLAFFDDVCPATSRPRTSICARRRGKGADSLQAAASNS
jgi:hypothetical protein